MRTCFLYSIFLNLRTINMIMKKLTILFCLICFIFSSSFSEEIRLTDAYNQFKITDNSTEEFSFVSSFANFTTKVIKTKEGNFVKIIVNFLSLSVGLCLSKYCLIYFPIVTYLQLIHTQKGVVSLQ